MKKLFSAATAAFLIIAAPTTQATESQTIDRDAIETTAKSDDYASLLRHFTDGEQLTPDEIATVYYGSVFQPGFNADMQYPSLTAAYAAGEMTKALRLCEEALAKDPTNLSLLFKAYAAARSSTDATVNTKATIFQNRIIGICDAIFASGSGVTETSPYTVIRPSDIDDFLIKYIQPTAVKGRARISDLDAVKVTLDGLTDDVILYFATF